MLSDKSVVYAQLQKQKMARVRTKTIFSAQLLQPKAEMFHNAL